MQQRLTTCLLGNVPLDVLALAAISDLALDLERAVSDFIRYLGTR